VWASQRCEEEWEEMDEEGGATRVELRVTASFRIFSASFQCTVSTNLDTARSRSNTCTSLKKDRKMPWLKGLEKVQERAVKMVAGLKSVWYEDRCDELGLETLQVRRDRLNTALVHKYIGKENQTLFTMMSKTRE
jgi:hypothetical protein